LQGAQTGSTGMPDDGTSVHANEIFLLR